VPLLSVPSLSNPASTATVSLDMVHAELRLFVNALLSEFPESESIYTYFVRRAHHERAIKQDLLPLLVFQAISGQEHMRAMPLAASWALYLAAGHLLDKGQDEGDWRRINDSVKALSLANLALVQLEASQDTVRDTLEAFSRVTALGASAQSNELRRGRNWSKKEYFVYIAGKAAAIIATGVWVGGRLATSDNETLSQLKEFGLALGMSLQISDDCLDLVEDLTHGVYTLPVIEGVALTEHSDQAALRQLLTRAPLTPDDARRVAHILNGMGVMGACHRMIRAYQVQAAAMFTLAPALAQYFADYVTPKSQDNSV
jgi:geranylgeranyl pyrophosphate synthase